MTQVIYPIFFLDELSQLEMIVSWEHLNDQYEFINFDIHSKYKGWDFNGSPVRMIVSDIEAEEMDVELTGEIIDKEHLLVMLQEQAKKFNLGSAASHRLIREMKTTFEDLTEEELDAYYKETYGRGIPDVSKFADTPEKLRKYYSAYCDTELYRWKIYFDKKENSEIARFLKKIGKFMDNFGFLVY